MLPSRVDKVQFKKRSYFIKRDDLIDPCLSGNKYRKLYSLLQTPNATYTKVISYGGGQSNAMYSIACLCEAKGWEFHYYTKTLPQFLKDGVEGNLALAIDKGMVVHEVDHDLFQDKISALQETKEDKRLLITQGAADKIAKEGVCLLADEIYEWKKSQNITKLSLVLPSGTGTTALYLSQAVDKDTQVFTSVLVGDEAYQYEQWKKLSDGPYPHVFPSKNKHKFAKPYDEYLETYKALYDETGIEFDLIYAPKTWMQMYDNIKDNENVMYIHTGGVSGNSTMLERYRHKRKANR